MGSPSQNIVGARQLSGHRADGTDVDEIGLLKYGGGPVEEVGDSRGSIACSGGD